MYHIKPKMTAKRKSSLKKAEAKRQRLEQIAEVTYELEQAGLPKQFKVDIGANVIFNATPIISRKTGRIMYHTQGTLERGGHVMKLNCLIITNFAKLDSV